MLAKLPAEHRIENGSEREFAVPPDKMFLFDRQTEERLACEPVSLGRPRPRSPFRRRRTSSQRPIAERVPGGLPSTRMATLTDVLDASAVDPAAVRR